MNETLDTIIERIGAKFQAMQTELATSRAALRRAVVELERTRVERDEAVAQLERVLAERDQLQQLLAARREPGDVLTIEPPEVLLSDADWRRLAD